VRPCGRSPAVIWICAALTVTVNCLLAVAPAVSVTRIVKPKLPVVVGVPESVLPESATPGGSVPLLTDHE